jgi:hypothetical protein
MRKVFITAILAFSMALTGLAGVALEAGAVADEQANCVGEVSSTSATTVDGELTSELAQEASSNCGEGGPEPPKKKEPIQPA